MRVRPAAHCSDILFRDITDLAHFVLKGVADDCTAIKNYKENCTKNCHDSTGCDIVSVSYTHLDVYKRQVCVCVCVCVCV